MTAALTGRAVIFFDIDGTLIDTGGAGAASWRLAFDEVYGIPAEVGTFTDADAAGVACAGVASHHFNAEQLRAAGADWVVDSLKDGLPDVALRVSPAS